MKKLMFVLFVLFISVLLVGTASAFNFELNDRLTYKNNDLKVSLDNWWGLGKTIGTAELKSHKTVNEVLKFGYGKEEVVMYYDFDFGELYQNGLGEVTFTDKRTGKEIEKDYSFVYWGTKAKQRNVHESFSIKNINGTISNENIITGTENYTWEGWLPYDSKDIPKGKIRIGLKTFANKGDYIDGVWTIASKKIKRHAEWTASLNAQLISYFKLDNTYGNDTVVDSTGNMSGTLNSGATRGATGIINTSFDFEAGDTDSVNLGEKLFNYTGTQPFTMSLWIKLESDCDCALISNDKGDNGNWNLKRRSDDAIGLEMNDAGELTGNAIVTDTGVFYHIVLVMSATDEIIYVNGTQDVAKGSRTSTLPKTTNTNGRIGQTPAGGASFDGIIDEVGMWNRSLSASEVSDLYNDGIGITYTNVFAPTISVFSPTNTTFTDPTIFFNFSAGQTIDQWIVNYNGTNVTNFTPNTTLTVEDGFHQLRVYANNSVGQVGLNDSIFFTVSTGTTISVFSPTNTTFSTSTIFFNATNDTQSVDKWIVNYNGTNVTLSDINTTLEVEEGSTFNLKIYANNSATGIFGLNESIFFSVDITNPSLNVTEPFKVINFHDDNDNQTLRFNVSDIHIDTCLLQYEGLNTTVDCSTNITNFTVGTDRTLTFFANDTFGNTIGQVVNWSYLVLQRSTTFNSSSFETEAERFRVNVTTNGTAITLGTLTFDGTANTGATVTNPAGDNYSITKVIAIPISIGTKTHTFNLTISGKIINTTDQSQVINLTNLTLCQASPQNIAFINITFKNETLAEESVNATISSTWTYSLSALSGVNKTLTFTNASENPSYAFCSTPGGRSLNIQLDMDYANSISQQRSFSLTTALTNSSLQQVLYLLPTSLGLFSPFKTTTINGDTIAFVSAVITRVLSGNTITVATGITDSSGFATFFLNPNALHSATFSKTGFANNVFTFTPTAELRTVVMGGGGVISNGTVISRGTTYTISPLQSTLPNNTVVSFTFNVTSNLTTITLISMNITNSSNTQLLFVSNAGVGNLSGTLNTLNNTKLFGSYIIQTAEETISVTKIWNIFTTFAGDYSIFTQLTLAKDNELITDFTRLILILAFMSGVLIFMNNKKIIETSESNIAVLLLMAWAFSIVGWLDTGLAVATTDSGINSLGEFSNQYGIAMLLTLPGIFFIFRRLFIRIPR